MKNIIIALSILLICGTVNAGERCEQAKGVKVIDGDTIRVKCDGQRIIVRLIGIDSPETKHPKKSVQCFGHEAAEYLKSRIAGKRVRLAYGDERQDKYGRTLAYVYLGRDFINAEMVKKGYAFAYTRFPFEHRDSFVAYEADARQQGRGLWRVCEVVCKGNVCRTEGGNGHMRGR